MINEIGARAKLAARVLAAASADIKNRALLDAARRVEAGVDGLLSANRADLEKAAEEGISDALVDRLRLTENRILAMAGGLRQIASLPDPVGQVTGGHHLHNGIRLTRIRVPLGVVAVIYEARPNVTADAAGLCIKSGNATVLRGSSYALHSNLAVSELLRAALEAAGLPADGVQLMKDTSREAARELMQAKEWIDLLVPRGGPNLIAAIEADATVPVVIDGAGNCHVYVDRSADLQMAEQIVLNAKTSRPGVCNAAEKLLVHQEVAAEFLPRVAKLLLDHGVELRGDEGARQMVGEMDPATDTDWPTEYLDLVMAVRVVPTLESALEHIGRYGTGHTEVIVTADAVAADRFVAGTDSAVVAVNTSSRFTDGEEFGYGAEIGISTQKLHVRGPMGLEALTSERYVLRGEGQVR